MILLERWILQANVWKYPLGWKINTQPLEILKWNLFLLICLLCIFLKKYLLSENYMEIIKWVIKVFPKYIEALLIFLTCQNLYLLTPAESFNLLFPTNHFHYTEKATNIEGNCSFTKSLPAFHDLWSTWKQPKRWRQ